MPRSPTKTENIYRCKCNRTLLIRFASDIMVNDGSGKKNIRKPVGSPYSWQDVTSVLINNIPVHVATKNEIEKELETFQQTFITFGM